MSRRYVIVTPARDEEAHLEGTIRSMAAQTVLPLQWVIVNDGSRDATGKILDRLAAEYPWITPVHRADRGFRKSGGGVVEAFNEGYKALRDEPWDYIVKLDGDLSFAPDYFEQCFRKFEADAKLGIGGGMICHMINGVKVIEEVPAFHVRGATKIYRAKCWEDIGGFWPAPGWDTMDEVKASRLGWVTRSFPDLELIHHRFTGAADGTWGNLVKNGRANYICGYHPLFMISKCLVRLARKPYLVGSVALMYGFLSGYIKKIPQVSEPETIAYLRQQQMNRLMGRATIWQ
jgi:biofilm PGA synthesis N-glycosyltransferase PgaC